MILRFCPVPVSAMRACLTQEDRARFRERRMQELSALAPAIRWNFDSQRLAGAD